MENVLQRARSCVDALQDPLTFDEGLETVLVLSDELGDARDVAAFLPVEEVQEFGAALHAVADEILPHLAKPSEKSQEMVQALTFILEILRGYTKVQMAQVAPTTEPQTYTSKAETHLAKTRAQIERLEKLAKEFELDEESVLLGICDVMQSNLENPIVLRHACKCLASLGDYPGKDEDYQYAFETLVVDFGEWEYEEVKVTTFDRLTSIETRVGTLASIQAAIHQHPSNRELRRDAVEAIGKVARYVSPEDLVHAGILNTVCNLINQHPSDGGLAYSAGWVVHNIVGNMSSEQLDQQAVGLKTLLETIREHPEINLGAYDALGYIVAKMSVEQLIQSGTVDVIVGPLRLLPSDGTILRGLFCTLQKIARETVIEIGAIDAILAALKTDLNSSQKMECCSLLSSWVNDDKSAQLLMEAGAGDAIVKAMANSNFVVCESCAKVIRKLTTNSAYATTFVRLGAADAVVEHLSQVQQLYSDSDSEILGMLLNLAWDHETQLTLVKIGIADAIVEVLDRSSKFESRLKVRCLTVLYNLSLAPGVAKKLRRKRILKHAKDTSSFDDEIPRKLISRLSWWPGAKDGQPKMVSLDGGYCDRNR